MRYITKLFLISILFSPVFAWTQDISNFNQGFYQVNLSDYATRIDLEEQYLNKLDLKTIPYLYGEWKKGSIKIVINDKASMQAVNINIDAQKNRVLATVINNEIFAVPLKYLDSIFVNVNENQTDIYVTNPKNKVEGGKKEEPLLYQIVYSGENILLKRTTKVFREAASDTNYGNGLKQNEYQTSVRYFAWSASQKNYLKVNLNFKSLEKIFPEKKKDISKMKNDPTLDLTKEEVFVETLASIENE
ncbi:MAG: hypothetical protein AAFO07_31735 [Bacteroidota bacterium]